MIRYIFRNDDPKFFLNADAADPQRLGEAIEKAVKESDDPATLIVEQARDHPRHAFHKHINWNVEEAAAAHWKTQVQNIIRAIRVDDTKQQTQPRAFLSLATKEGSRSYHHIEEVRNSAELQIAVLQQAERDLVSFERRYQELLEECKLVRSAREAVQTKIGALKAA